MSAVLTVATTAGLGLVTFLVERLLCASAEKVKPKIHNVKITNFNKFLFIIFFTNWRIRGFASKILS
jgi:hypothetical protein